MERNYGQEIDALRGELVELRRLLMDQRGPLAETPPEPEAPAEQPPAAEPEKVGHIYKMYRMHPNPRIMALLDELENKCGAKGCTGALAYVGVFSSGGRQSTWARDEVNTDELLYLIENKMAGKVLQCIGNDERLKLLLAILRQPMTVAQLVEQCGYSSTGQVYHHLKPLVAADLVVEGEGGRGVYCIQPHRVQGVIMLLAGISDMLDPKYTQGDWEALQ